MSTERNHRNAMQEPQKPGKTHLHDTRLPRDYEVLLNSRDNISIRLPEKEPVSGPRRASSLP